MGDKWKDLGRATCWDSKRDGTKITTKKGVPYFSGFMNLALDSGSVEVLVNVYPSREGTVDVSISLPPPKDAT